ncbi:MAG: site-2 protease family protein [Chloroflexota bacterium]
MNLEQLVPRIIAILLILLVAFPVHEFAHALAAYRLGDGTARLFGRLTLNPIAHFDPMGGIILIISGLTGFIIGWAKPTPVNPLNLGGGRNGEAIVAFAGPASNLVLAVMGALPLRYIQATGLVVPDLLWDVLILFVFYNVILMLLNLLPVAPLDGSKLLFALMSPQTAWRWRPIFEQWGFLILIGAAFLPILPGGNTVLGLVFDTVGVPLVNLLIGF